MCCCHGFLPYSHSTYCVRDSRGEMVGLQLGETGCAQDLAECALTWLALSLWPMASHDTFCPHQRQIHVLLNQVVLFPTWVHTGLGCWCLSSIQRAFTHRVQGCMCYRTIRECQRLEEIIFQIMTLIQSPKVWNIRKFAKMEHQTSSHWSKRGPQGMSWTEGWAFSGETHTASLRWFFKLSVKLMRAHLISLFF